MGAFQSEYAPARDGVSIGRAALRARPSGTSGQGPASWTRLPPRPRVPRSPREGATGRSDLAGARGPTVWRSRSEALARCPASGSAPISPASPARVPRGRPSASWPLSRTAAPSARCPPAGPGVAARQSARRPAETAGRAETSRSEPRRQASGSSPRRSAHTWRGGIVRMPMWIDSPSGGSRFRPWGAVWVTKLFGLVRTRFPCVKKGSNALHEALQGSCRVGHTDAFVRRSAGPCARMGQLERYGHFA